MIDPQLREDGPPITDRMLRQFAGLWLAFFGGLAAWQYFMHDRPTAAAVLAVVGLTVAAWGLLFPGGIRPLFVGLVTLTRPIGWVVSKVLLLILYYLVFTPVALVFKLIGRDALGRRRQPDASTYWREKPAPAEMGSYYRQS